MKEPNGRVSVEDKKETEAMMTTETEPVTSVQSDGTVILPNNSSVKTTEVIANGKGKGNKESFLSFIKSLDFKVLPTDEIWTYDRQKPVKLRSATDTNHAVDSSSSSTSSSATDSPATDSPVTDSPVTDSPATDSPVTVMTAFANTVQRFPSHTALATKVDGNWKTWTFEKYFDDVIRAAKSLIAVGVQPFDGVGIIGFNSPEWFIANIAAIFAGGLSTGFYTTNSAEMCKFVAQNADCSVIFVDNDHQLQKILSVREQLPALKVIVQYKGKVKAEYDNVYTWDAFMKLGEEGVSDEELKHRIERQHCNQCCSLIYTSGTTGNPKGVMLSHDNVTWQTIRTAKTLRLKDGEEIIVSYLPLNHVAAQILDVYLPLICGFAVYFAQPDAMKGSLDDSLKEVRPTIFFGVPRVWEKMAEKMKVDDRKNGILKRTLLQWSRQIGLNGSLSTMNGGSTPMGWSLADQLVFRKIREDLGLDRCRLFFSAAAPIMAETLEFFASINIPLMEVFGLSETAGPHTISTPWKWRITSVGCADDPNSITISNPNNDGEGEVCLDGRNVFMGYLNEPEKTRDTLDEKLRLKTGDLGKIDPDGFVYITGRIKELIITAGGENVAPVPIEDAVKDALSSCVSNCMVIGDKRKFLSILITLKTEVDPTTFDPTDRLCPTVVHWCRSVGSQLTTVSEVIAKVTSGQWDPMFDAIQAGINTANKKAVSRAQTIQKWIILPRDFTVANEELGPTLKLKRNVVAHIYASTIESLYADKEKQ